jgi:hypothetical protein
MTGNPTADNPISFRLAESGGRIARVVSARRRPSAHMGWVKFGRVRSARGVRQLPSQNQKCGRSVVDKAFYLVRTLANYAFVTPVPAFPARSQTTLGGAPFNMLKR